MSISFVRMAVYIILILPITSLYYICSMVLSSCAHIRQYGEHIPLRIINHFHDAPTITPSKTPPSLMPARVLKYQILLRTEYPLLLLSDSLFLNSLPMSCVQFTPMDDIQYMNPVLPLQSSYTAFEVGDTIEIKLILYL